MVNKQGRPPKLADDDKRSRDHQLAVQLTKQERAVIDGLARLLRCSSSEVVRRAVAAFAERFK